MSSSNEVDQLFLFIPENLTLKYKNVTQYKYFKEHILGNKNHLRLFVLILNARLYRS